jgi:hypothetical protein
MVRNKSTVGVAVAVALLSLWATPAVAQRSTARKSVSKQRPGKQKPGKQRPGKQKPGNTRAPTSEPEAKTFTDAPVAEQPASVETRRRSSSLADGTGDRPWAQDVSQTQQEAADTFFQSANTLLKESVFVQAADKYRKALEEWDHPAIHYNLALALMNLDQPIEVYEHLVAAMKHGPEPLEVERFEYARNYKTLIEKQLARVEITCETPGATVTMDGKTLFVAPGRYAGLVRPGAHSIIATREGYVPSDMSRALMPGETAKLEMKMFTSEDLFQYRRKWPVAVPWVVLGTGVAMAAGSGFLHMQSRDSFRSFDVGITECGGCVPAPDVSDRLTRGNTYQNVAIGGYAIGGAALLTGAVLAFLNQPEAYRVDQKPAETVNVTPLVGGGTTGVLTTFRF